MYFFIKYSVSETGLSSRGDYSVGPIRQSLVPVSTESSLKRCTLKKQTAMDNVQKRNSYITARSSQTYRFDINFSCQNQKDIAFSKSIAISQTKLLFQNVSLCLNCT
jgi:hypothetical protein